MDTAQSMLLEYSHNKTIESMLNLTPNYSTGKKFHELILNKLMEVLPGNYKTPFNKEVSFRQTFYANWHESPLTRYIESDTGLNNTWWENFSIVLLCQSIYYLNSTIKKQLAEDRINNAVDQAKEIIKQQSYLFYSRVLTEFPPFSSLLNDLKKQQAETDGKSMFREAMLRNVKVWMLWYAEGWWKNPDWDLFNNYAKYIALGADEAAVDNLIEDMANKGLPVPASVDKINWRHYTQYLDGQPGFDHTSIDNTVRDAVLASYYWNEKSPFGGNQFSPSLTLTLKNYYSGEFVSKDKPGARFAK